MSRDTTVIAFRQPDNINDPLTELAREGARRMLAQVLVAEADAFVAMWKDLKLPDGRDRIARHGHGPDRTIQTGVGPVEVRRAKVRDRYGAREHDNECLPLVGCPFDGSDDGTDHVQAQRIDRGSSERNPRHSFRQLVTDNRIQRLRFGHK